MFFEVVEHKLTSIAVNVRINGLMRHLTSLIMPFSREEGLDVGSLWSHGLS